MRLVDHLRAHLLRENLTWEKKTTTMVTLPSMSRLHGDAAYLVQRVVGGHGHAAAAAVQQQLLAQEGEEALGVHDLHLSPVWKNYFEIQCFYFENLIPEVLFFFFFKLESLTCVPNV